MMQMPKPPKPKKKYKLYCPQTPSDTSGKGYNTFNSLYYKCENNVIEQLIRIGEMLEWYQIVDTRDNFRVIKERLPENY